MIERNPALPDHFLVLERKETFGEYAQAYGDAIAEHLENRGVIVVPYMPIDFDLTLFQSLTFPAEWKKIGTLNGIEESLYTRNGTTLTDRVAHPFRELNMGVEWASYLQAQVASFDAQLRRGLQILFPAYVSLRDGNITWRLTETVEEGMHLDVFAGGAPINTGKPLPHRLKVFINIDAEPRSWRTSLDLPGVLSTCRESMPAELPDDVNVVNDIIDKMGVLKTLPYHRLTYPAMSAVICNGEAVAHEVVYGQRTVGAEFMCHQQDMLDPNKHTHSCMRGWIEKSGYKIAPDPAAVVNQYAHMKGSHALIQEARASAVKN